jgi:hypothetical protein
MSPYTFGPLWGCTFSRSQTWASVGTSEVCPSSPPCLLPSRLSPNSAFIVCSAHFEFAATVEATSRMSDDSDGVAVMPGSPG